MARRLYEQYGRKLDDPAFRSFDELVGSIRAGEANRMLDAGAFEGGIVPKLRAAAVAAASGITAHIGATAVVA